MSHCMDRNAEAHADGGVNELINGISFMRVKWSDPDLSPVRKKHLSWRGWGLAALLYPRPGGPQGWAPEAPWARSGRLHLSALAKGRPSLASRVKAGNQGEALTALVRIGAARHPSLPPRQATFASMFPGSLWGSHPDSRSSVEQEHRECSLQKGHHHHHHHTIIITSVPDAVVPTGG